MIPHTDKKTAAAHPTAYSAGVGHPAGFEIRDAESFYGENAPRFLVAQTLGVAVSPRDQTMRTDKV
ncbi:hypothetical protein [Nocardia abscessus]|uniref:hypothetical protein n=1 Tax=Nocardia abscessus TaxID=120957 RepID=UPI0024550793|nr:hypothetical protein [Nocardia abscessus]